MGFFSGPNQQPQQLFADDFRPVTEPLHGLADVKPKRGRKKKSEEQVELPVEETALALPEPATNSGGLGALFTPRRLLIGAGVVGLGWFLFFRKPKQPELPMQRAPALTPDVATPWSQEAATQPAQQHVQAYQQMAQPIENPPANVNAVPAYAEDPPASDNPNDYGVL